MIAIICFLSFSQAIINQSYHYIDSLYLSGQYSDFINYSKNKLLKNPELRNDFLTVLKLAEASFQEGKFDLAEKVYDKAKAIDSLLNDYIDYKKIDINLHKKDTARYFELVDQFIENYPDFILNKQLLKQSIRFGVADRYYQKLKKILNKVGKN